jgi:H+/Cl- antiporter ClcA
MKEYAALIVLGVIFSFLAWIYLSIYFQSKRYNKKIKRLKKLKTRLKGIRRNRVR